MNALVDPDVEDVEKDLNGNGKKYDTSIMEKRLVAITETR
jgi:hypothetical protein